MGIIKSKKSSKIGYTNYNENDLRDSYGLDVEEKLLNHLSEELARGIDKNIIDGIFEMNEKDNRQIIEKVFPGQDIQSVCETIGIEDLRKEYNLTEKIRNWKINKINF